MRPFPTRYSPLATRVSLLRKQPAQRARVVPVDVGDAPGGADLEQFDYHPLGLAEVGEAYGGGRLAAGFLGVDVEPGDVPFLVADEGIAVEGRRLAALLRRRLVVEDERGEAGREIAPDGGGILERNALLAGRADIAPVDLLDEVPRRRVG